MSDRSARTPGGWRRPDRLAWWIGILFAIGSLLFLVPALAALGSDAAWIDVTFFSGSIFFTSASLLQLLAAAEVPHRLRPGARRSLRPRAWMPAHVDWLAAAVQFPGTVLFNLNTFDAMSRHLSASAQDVRVWAPDAIGSGCFLVASLLAFANAEHRWLSFRPRDLDWWIAATNLAGSVFFGVAALAAFVRPDGAAVDDWLSNAATAAGAACFLVGALLLLPQAERQERRAAEAARGAAQ